MEYPSINQLERHIRNSAANSAHVIFTDHARVRMRQRTITAPMVLDVLRSGVMAKPAEPGGRREELICRMQRFVAGLNVAVVVALEIPKPDLIVITVMDVRKD